MKIQHKPRSKKGLDLLRVSSAVILLAVLVLVVTETAKYLYSAKIPKSVSSKIEPSVDKLASVLGIAKTSLSSLEADDKDTENFGEESSGEEEQAEFIEGEEDSDRTPSKVLVRIAVLSDVHNDFEYLKKTLVKIKGLDVNYVVFLGDYTDYGDIDNLTKAKALMNESGIPFVSIPGDHDLAETRDESNFKKLFGITYGLLEEKEVKITYFDNSKNFTPLESSLITWFEKEVLDTDILFLSQPLMTESMSRVMGIIDGVRDKAVYDQNRQLLSAVRKGKVRVIVAGDLHRFSKYEDPERAGLRHYTVGAILQSQSLEKLNLQPPRFAILTVHEDNSYRMEDIAID